MDNIDEIKKNILDMEKENIQALHDLTEIHSKDLQQLFDFILEDMFESYDALIQQREQIIDKYVKLIGIILQDEKDISKPIQSMVEKKHHDIAELQKEIVPLKEFKRVMFSQDVSDEQADEVLDLFKNI